MSRYDEVIKENRQNKADQIADKSRKMSAAEEKKQRYVAAFARALPEYHQALVKNDIWRVYKRFRKVLFVETAETIECVQLQCWDNREYWFTHCGLAITKDGRYIRLIKPSVDKRGKNYVDTVADYEEMNADQFAQRIYDGLHLEDNWPFHSRDGKYQKLNEALKNDDADELAFQYFAFCLPK